MDLAQFKNEYAELYQAIFDDGSKAGHAEGFLEGEKAGVEKGRVEGREAGAEAERKRIRDVEAQALPGHEDLIAKLKFDGKTSGPEAAVQVLQAERALGTKTVAELDADAVKPVKHATPPETEGKVVENKDLPAEERAKASWDNNPAIRTEFESDYDSYLAYYRANDKGQVKVLGERSSK